MNIAVFSLCTGRPFLEAVTAALGVRHGKDHLMLCMLNAAEEALEQATCLGADEVLSVCADVQADPSALLEDLTRRFAFDTVIFPDGCESRLLAARLAYRLGGDCVADCTELEWVDEQLRVTRWAYASHALAVFNIQCSFCAAVIRDKTFPPANEISGHTVLRRISYSGPLEPYPVCWAELPMQEDLDHAKIVVVGGRGIENQDDLALLEEFSQMIGAVLGATRPLVMNGLVPSARQIGQSGRSIAPDLCIAVAVSGSTPFLAGLGSSVRLLAINRDPDANIFKHANYGLIADYRTLLPTLMKQWRTEKHGLIQTGVDVL